MRPFLIPSFVTVSIDHNNEQWNDKEYLDSVRTCHLDCVWVGIMQAYYYPTATKVLTTEGLRNETILYITYTQKIPIAKIYDEEYENPFELQNK